MRFTSRKRIATQPDLTPLIDCTFQLLIFFAVTTTFASRSGIQVRLPQSAAAEIKAEEKNITITINKEGDVFIKGGKVEPGRLGQTITEVASSALERTVLIEADKESHHGKVVSVMDELRRAGISKIGIMTQPAPGETPRNEEPNH